MLYAIGCGDDDDTTATVTSTSSSSSSSSSAGGMATTSSSGGMGGMGMGGEGGMGTGGDGGMGGAGGMAPTDTVVMTFDEMPPIDFRTFGGAGFSIAADPTDGNNSVGQFDKLAPSETFAGAVVWYCANEGIPILPITAMSTVMTVRVYSPETGKEIRLKVENSNNPGESVETVATTTMTNAWETLTFDFSMEAPGTAALNPAFTFDKMVLFADFGVAKAANDTPTTWYFDDITFTNEVFPLTCPPVTSVINPSGTDNAVLWNGGTPGLENAAAGAHVIGNAAAGSNYVMPFQLPTPLPAGGFTSANLTINIENIFSDPTWLMTNIDLYGLGYRSGDAVLTTDFYANPAVDGNATLIADSFITPQATTGALSTDAAAQTALLNYLNAQVQAGAVAGDYVFLRLGPDIIPPIGAAYSYLVSSQENAPQNRPALTVQ